jgi:polyisoprenoid-binding protein YceI
LVLAFVALSTTAQAQHTLKFTGTSKVAIEGSSNLHKWTCASSDIQGSATVTESATAEVGKDLTAMTVAIPVQSLDCGHGDMNDNLRKAMHADRHASIVFRMTSYTATPKGGAYDAVVKGTLTINGVDKPAELRATVTPNGSGGAGVIGSTPLNTETFDVKRVKIMLGTLRTSPDVTITFRLSATR